VSASRLLTPGRPWPLGAHVNAQGVNFAVFSAHATAMDLCLYDEDGREERQRLPLPARSGDVWHGHLSGAGAGAVYGYRAHGPWQPRLGHRFDADQLLLDPYAREFVGQFSWDAPRLSVPKARVVHDSFDWQGDAPPRRPWSDTVFYELHVRGFSKLHPGVPEAQRGTFAGLASDAALAHFQRLGITALSLLPVQHFLDEQRLVRMGLRNYWGYNTLGFFCLQPRYGIGGRDGRELRDEFRHMVRRLHAAGIEVILDVVYNHSAETDETGPTLSWRGLDNASYYLLRPDDASLYENHTGCGNTFNLAHPRVLQMVLDSLRFWVQEMHVDGFRFDLAAALGRRGAHGFDRHAAFFACLAQDPVLAGVKLVAEPWDIGPGGYQLGRFPAGWLEWNDRFRDTARAFWLGHAATRGDFAQRLCGSSDRFRTPGRLATDSLNYVVSHDGFTLRDLVSHDRRHNLANGEHNRDGPSDNLSWNCGIEGDTADADVLQRRGRLQRALLTTVLLAQGTPMLAAGDELGHGQQGNNNPYCQDNPITWIDWSRADSGLMDFCAALVALRRALLPLGPQWYDDARSDDGRDGLRWLQPDGSDLQGADWHAPHERAFALHIGHPGRCPMPLLLLVNPDAQPVRFRLPPGTWQLLLDSAQARVHATGLPARSAEHDLPARSLGLLQLQPA